MKQRARRRILRDRIWSRPRVAMERKAWLREQAGIYPYQRRILEAIQRGERITMVRPAGKATIINALRAGGWPVMGNLYRYP